MHAKVIELKFQTNLVSTIEQRINTFHKLGELFRDISEHKKNSIYKEWIKKYNKNIISAYQYNNWFTEENILLSLNNWSKELTSKNLSSWINKYQIKDCSNKTVAIIMAGNLPLVGFHDFICANLLNFNCLIKLSSDDKILFPLIVDFMDFILPGYKNKINFTEQPLKNFNGVIATGSNSSFKYFEYYFNNYPKLLRKNRHSIAVLDGNETKNDLSGLGDDIFNYFGMGCRSVSKIFVPSNYNFDLLFRAVYKFKDVINHNRYANNYDYNKTVYLMSEQKFIENGFFMLKEDKKLGSPIACLFYEKYNSNAELEKYIKSKKNSLQCVVTNLNIPNTISFGESQKPKIDDYADNVDTLDFLLKI